MIHRPAWPWLVTAMTAGVAVARRPPPGLGGQFPEGVPPDTRGRLPGPRPPPPLDSEGGGPRRRRLGAAALRAAPCAPRPGVRVINGNARRRRRRGAAAGWPGALAPKSLGATGARAPDTDAGPLAAALGPPAGGRLRVGKGAPRGRALAGLCLPAADPCGCRPRAGRE